jgi:glycosyltransferase involved in cell wall biosynthesis
MEGKPKYSVIVPVYNRPDEIRDLLASLVDQQLKDFEVIVVEDGSATTCREVFEQFSDQLAIQYFYKPNSGPGPSRNFGFEKSNGSYFVVFDSDCILPPHYLGAVEQGMQETFFDAWGGPDKGRHDFTLLQQAMAYTMSSFLTTGGIRGGKKKLGWFQPRSFNMGISREVYQATGGFRLDRYAEDIELSIRIRNAGFKIEYVADAFVYHKRRTSFSQFYQQVKNFGKGRAMIGKLHPTEVKLTHWLPTIFALGVVLSLILLLINSFLGLLMTGCYLGYALALMTHAFQSTRSLTVSLLSVPSAFIQLLGYGLGFIKEQFKG